MSVEQIKSVSRAEYVAAMEERVRITKEISEELSLTVAASRQSAYQSNPDIRKALLNRAEGLEQALKLVLHPD